MSVNLGSAEGFELIQAYIRGHPEVWNEDVGTH